MIRLQLNDVFLDVNLTLTTPYDVTRVDATYSTDFELPFTPEVMQALQVGSVLSQPTPREVKGYVYVNEFQYPCVVRIQSFEREKVTCFITLTQVPNIFFERICDIVAERRWDIFFNIPRDPATSHDYLSYRYWLTGNDDVDALLPSISAPLYFALLSANAGIPIDISSLESIANYIALDKILTSPNIYDFSFYYWRDNERGRYRYFVTDSAYISVIQVRAVYLQGWITFKVLANCKYRFQPSHLSPLIYFIINGVVYDSWYVDAHGDFMQFAKGDVVVIVLDAIHNTEEPFYYTKGYFTDITDAEPRIAPISYYDGLEAFRLNNEGISRNEMPSPAKYGFFGSFDCKLIDLLKDIAVYNNKIVTFRYGFIALEDTSVTTLNYCEIKTINLADDGYFAKKCYATFSNEKRQLVAEYEDVSLQDEMDVVELTAEQPEGVVVNEEHNVEVAQLIIYDGNNYKGGNSYFIAKNNLPIPGVTDDYYLSPLAIPSQQHERLLTAEVVTPEDISRVSNVNIDGHEWQILERELGDDGLFYFTAIIA